MGKREEGPKWVEMPSVSKELFGKLEPGENYHDLGLKYPDAPVPRDNRDIIDHRAQLNDISGISQLMDWVSEGDIVIVELPDVGSSIEKDGNAGVVESTKAASDVYTPISGEVMENNQAIVDDPGKINSDPENEAWFFKLKIKDSSELDSLMNKEEYDKFAKESGN